MPAARSRLTFVLSHDFGELFNALYFLTGTPVEATLLLPPRLYELNGDRLPWPTIPYQAADDVARAVADADPDLLLLFSGYLFVVNKILAAEQVQALFSGWRREGRRLLTSDPALGLMADLDERTFGGAHPARDWLRQHFDWLGRLLADTYHLYLAPSGITQRAPHGSFYNPRYAPAFNPASDRADRYWLFVISPEDYLLQIQTQGRPRFADLLARRLNEVAQSGVVPVLVGPQTLREDLRGFGIEEGQPPEDEAASAPCRPMTLPGLNLVAFLRLLHRAQYVFYWNMYSASMLARVVAGQPFFVFDRGHLVRAMPPILPLGRRHFYAGCDVDLLDLRVPLDASRLGELAARQASALLAASLDDLARSPAPESVVAQLLALPAVSGGEAPRG